MKTRKAFFLIDSKEFSQILNVKEVDVAIVVEELNSKEGLVEAVVVSFFDVNLNPSISFLGVECRAVDKEVIELHLIAPKEKHPTFRKEKVNKKTLKEALSKVLSENEGAILS